MGDIPEFDESYELSEILTDEIDSDVRESMIEYYNDTAETSGEGLSEEDFFGLTKSHNVCGPGYYVTSPIWREGNPDDGSPGWGCQACPTELPATQEDYESMEMPEPRPSLDNLRQMCSSDVVEWFPPQYEMDVSGTTQSGDSPDWTSVAVATDAGVNVMNVDLYQKWFDDRYLLSQSDLSDIYNRSEYDGSLDQFKQAISDSRGSIVPCTTTDLPEGIEVPSGFQCSQEGTFGPDHIILDEYTDWRNSRVREIQEADPATLPTFGSELLPPNPGFETCMNNLLNEYDDQRDQDIIDGIYAAQVAGDITLLEDEHIQFIKRKLEMITVPSMKPNIINCIQSNVLIDSQLCNMGLTEQMYVIVNILMGVIGYNFTIGDISNTNTVKRDKMIQIIDSLGGLIPRVLRQIIEISSEIEINQCGAVSNKTLIIQDLYRRVFQPQPNEITVSNPFSSLVSEETSSTEFNRSTILAALGIAFLRYF